MQKMEDALIEMDALAEQAGGYFALPSEENIEYTDLLFDVCRQFESAIIPPLRRNGILLRK